MGLWNLNDLWKLSGLWKLSDFAMLALACAFAFHVLILVLFLGRRVLEQKVNMQNLSRLLKAVLLYSLFLQPVVAGLHLFFQTYESVWLAKRDDIFEYGMVIGNPSISTQTGYGNHWIFRLLFAAWLLGAVWFGMRRFLKELLLLKKLERFSDSAPDRELEEQMNRLRRELGVKGAVKLIRNPLVPGPFVTGFLRPRLFFPAGEMEEHVRELMLRHELVHCRRGDYIYRRLTAFACALFWYSPMVYYFADYFAQVNEMACDEKVLEGASDRERYCYAVLLAGFGEEGFALPNAVSLAGHTEDGLIRRIENVSKKRGKAGRRMRILLAASVCVCCPLISFAASSAVSRVQWAIADAVGGEEDRAAYKMCCQESGSPEPSVMLSEGDVVHIRLTGDGGSGSFRAGYEDGEKSRTYVTSAEGIIDYRFVISREGTYKFFVEGTDMDSIGVFGKITI